MIKTAVFILLFGFIAYGEIPESIKTYIKEVTPNVAELSIVPYFSTDQKKLIIENYADKLLVTFHSDIKKTKSFSKTELTAYLQQELRESLAENATLPKTTTLDKLLGTVSDIVLTKAYGKYPLFKETPKLPHGVVGAPWDDDIYLMQIRYQGMAYPVSIQIHGNKPSQESNIEIRLNGIAIDNNVDEDECLRVSFSLDSKELTVEWLASTKALCPLPDKQKGNFLLGFAEAIAKSLRLNTLKLWDQSSVVCVDNKKDIDLGMLKIFQQGKTWYESKGFAVRANDMKSYVDWKSQLLKYKLADVMANFDKLPDPSTFRLPTVPNLRQKQEKYANHFKVTMPQLKKFSMEFQKTGRVLFSDFMAWLYKHNCATYSDIFELIFDYNNFSDKHLYVGTLIREQGQFFYKHL